MTLVAGAIGPVIAEAAALLEPHAREQGFAIEVDIAPDLPAVRFDRDALLQVVFNLVDNALKYARSADDRVIQLDARQDGDTVGQHLAIRVHEATLEGQVITSSSTD